MKKSKPFGELFYRSLKKTLLIMRIAVILMILGILQANAKVTYSQETRLTFNFSETALVNVLNKIEDESEFFFLYNEKLLELDRKVNITVKDQLIGVILDNLFAGTDMKYTIMDRKIILAPNYLTSEQQQKQITGNVTDQKGVPIPGVTVIVKGTTTGTVTSSEGKYQISVPSDAKILLFSFVGMKSQEFVIGNSTTMNVTLAEETIDLQDVVVVGYGTQKKVNVIGSVTTISVKQITEAPVSNISNALAGRLPGAVIQQSSGEPGSDASTILIRGITTLGDNSPLVVIDGIPGRDLNSINANDVESISILKDASAAIYGARSANGVILVTTKRGMNKVPLTVNYSFYEGLLSPTRLPEMTDAPTYAKMIREMQSYMDIDEVNMRYSLEDIEKYESGEFPWTHPNTDWYDATMKKFSQSRNHNFAINGGSEALSYYASFGTQYDGDIFKNGAISFNRYNLKTTLEAKINKYLSVGLDINSSQENKTNPSMGTGENVPDQQLPTRTAFYPNGLPGPDMFYGQNPVVSTTDKTGFDDQKRYRVNNTFSADFKIPGVKGLVLSSYYAYDVELGQRKWFQKPWMLYQLDEQAYYNAGNTGKEDGSDFLIGSWRYRSLSDMLLKNYYDDSKTKTFNFKADYTNTIGPHNISAFVSYENSDREAKGISTYRRNIISDELPYLFAGGDDEKDNSEWISIDARVNYFGRLSYNYKETYLFQFSFRRDGSLMFSKEAGRWGNFPGVLAGWNIHKEKFWQDHLEFINFFKLKASWAQLGNDLVPAFQYLSSYGLSTGSVLGSDKMYYSGLRQTGAPNPNITWEVANIYNTGFESLFLNNKLSLNADFFYQRRNNILVRRNVSVPQFTGIRLPDENYGIVDNRGFEVVLGYTDHGKDFSYSINGNLAFARNKVIEFDEPAAQVPWQTLTGHPRGSQLLYNAIGIFRDEAQISNTPHVAGARPGDIILEDFDGDKEITPDDRILYTDTGTPEITFGSSFHVKYKNWSLDGLIQGQGNVMRITYGEYQGMGGNYYAYDAEGRWTPDNIDVEKPRAFERTQAYWRWDYRSNYYYHNSAYARMKNLKLTYTLPEKIQNAIHTANAEVYVSGQNLFMFYESGTKVLDPEANGDRPYHGNSRQYPLMRVYAIGVRITLQP